MRKLYAAVLSICLCLSAAGEEPPVEAFRTLQSQYQSEKNQAAKAKMAFALGVMAFKANNNQSKAVEFFNEALMLKTRLDDYAQYYLGLIEAGNKDFKGAKKHFEAVRSHQPPSIREADAEIELARIARIEERWGDAFNLLAHLERRHRHDPQYPDILYNLVEAGLAHKQKSEACRAALKLYSRLPGYTLAKGWGIRLSKVKVGNTLLPCASTVRDRERRLHNLILAGEFDEVQTEINDWVGSLRSDVKAHPEEMGRVELCQGELLQAEGKIKEAISHLLIAQDMMGRNPTAQMLLARAYSRTDDYGAAVEGYMRTFELSPRSKLGFKALFQAAFLSYQNRDYDGASRRFEEVVRRARGQIVWDARWHLAWIRYLKADYEGALKAFTELSRNKRYAKSVDLEKLHYWRAMSNYRLGFVEEARTLFTQLAINKRNGYYTGAAKARLAALPSGPSLIAPPTPTPSPSLSPGPMMPPVVPAGTTAETAPRAPASDDESLGGTKDTDKPDEENAEEEDEGKNVTPENAGEIISITSLKNPALVARFERAKDLIDLGFESWARLELREIERRTTNRGYLQMLMAQYMKAGDFYRSAFIGDVVFSYQREKSGIEGAYQLWTYAFPQAFARYVNSSSKKFDVAPELVWGVMRGESGFQEDIHSTAGAMGLMQLIPPTARQIARGMGYPGFQNSMLLNPETSILFGSWYLKRLNRLMDNNLPLTIASYNAGPHRVQGWIKDFGNLDMDEFIEHIPYQETRNYVKKVLRNYFVYQNLYSKKTNSLAWLSRKPSVKFQGPKPVAENWDD